MEPDIAREIERAREAAQNRDRKTARAILDRVLEQDPCCLEAWLMMARVAQQDAQMVHCLERVLKIDPENQEAREWLASLYSPSESYLVRVQRRAAADPLPVIDRLRKEFDCGPAAGLEFDREVPAGDQPGSPDKKRAPSTKAGSKGAGSPRSSARLEIALLLSSTVLFICMLAALSLAALNGQGRFPFASEGSSAQAAQDHFSIPGTRGIEDTQAVQATPGYETSLLYAYLYALEKEDLLAVLGTIYPGSPADQLVRETVRTVFPTCDQGYELSDVRIVQRIGQEVQLRFVLVTHRLAGPGAPDTRGVVFAVLRPDQGVWKIAEWRVESQEEIE